MDDVALVTEVADLAAEVVTKEEDDWIAGTQSTAWLAAPVHVRQLLLFSFSNVLATP